MTRPGFGADEVLVNVGLLAVGAIGALATVLRLSASLAAWLTSAPSPTDGPASGLAVLTHPDDPGAAVGAESLSPPVFWATVAVLLTTVAGAAWLIWRLFSRIQRTPNRGLHRIDGTADRRTITDTAGRRALLRRSSTLRPAVADPEAADVGYLVGTSRGREIWTSVEDSTLVLGPPRSGKGLHLVINAILDAPGPVITTATRPDNIAATLRARERRGPVAVFDPQRLAAGLPAGLRWSPIRGCENPLTAMIRATGLAAATGLGGGGVDSGSFWEGKTRTALQALLHAAALDHRTPRDLFTWTLSTAAAGDAVAILNSHPDAPAGWAEALDAMLNSDPRTRDSIWMGVSLALACLADPQVLDAVSPTPGEQFDPDTFLEQNGTLYLLATGAGAGAAWPLVAAFIEDLVETARHRAARSAGARLDPPLLLALDEIGNLAPLPSLPVLMAEGGGTGITTMPVLQSLAQARNKWGEHAASTIWDASIVKVILGGTSATRDLQDLSALIGERDEHTDSTSRGDHGSRSVQRSTRRVPILPPERIRTLPFGTGLVLLRSSPPIITDLRAWTSRKDATRLAADRRDIETVLGHRNAPSSS